MITFPIQSSDVEHFEKCLACNSPQIELISDVTIADGVTYLATSLCHKCGHVFRNIRPNEAWYMNAFGARHAGQQSSGINPINQGIEKDRYKRYQAISSYLRSNDWQVNRVLDVGCGPGSGLRAWEEAGLTVKGIDADASRAAYALKLGLDIYVGAWQDFKTDKPFDMITSIHSLEHFYAPDLFLKEIAEFSKDRGFLYVEVPDMLDHVKDWNDSLYLAHNSNFNPYSLALLASSNGWEPIQRVNPYANTGLCQKHLAMIFRKRSGEPLINNQLLNSEQVKNYAERIRQLYGQQIPAALPHHFRINAINDLSVSYKRNAEVKRAVDDNYIGRQARMVRGYLEVHYTTELN